MRDDIILPLQEGEDGDKEAHRGGGEESAARLETGRGLVEIHGLTHQTCMLTRRPLRVAKSALEGFLASHSVNPLPHETEAERRQYREAIEDVEKLLAAVGRAYDEVSHYRRGGRPGRNKPRHE